jgi:hypothetical protein
MSPQEDAAKRNQPLMMMKEHNKYLRNMVGMLALRCQQVQ